MLTQPEFAIQVPSNVYSIHSHCILPIRLHFGLPVHGVAFFMRGAVKRRLSTLISQGAIFCKSYMFVMKGAIIGKQTMTGL